MKYINCFNVSLKKAKLSYTVLLMVISILFSAVFLGYDSDNYYHETYFKNTENELNIYRINGDEPGPTLLIFGGIHNEPGGYLTADQYVDLPLRKGNLIIVPRTNFQAIINDQRETDGDMNRLFDLDEPRYEDDYEMEIVLVLKQLISECDYLLNLHDGSGFFRPDFIDDLHNPNRFGQSIITDIEYYSNNGNGDGINLREIAERICNTVNKDISIEEHHFRYNNHNTFSETTIHKEQRKSATYYALSTYNIPAFGIETSKDIGEFDQRVRYQSMIVDAFMEEIGIIKDSIRYPIDDPYLKFITVSVNNEVPMVFVNNSTINIRRGDQINIKHIEANYDRGLHADIIDFGSSNDFNKVVAVYSNTSIKIRKDSFDCGEININISENPIVDNRSNYQSVYPDVEGFIVRVNGIIKSVKNEGTFQILKGDKLELLDTSPSIEFYPEYYMNFFGYYSRTNRVNTGDDRNYVINTDTDLLPEFSIGDGKEYLVKLEKDEENVLGQMRIRLIEPELKHLVLKFNNGNKSLLENGDEFKFTWERSVEIIDVETNIPNNTGIRIDVRGFAGGDDGNDMNRPIDIYKELQTEYSSDSNGKIYAIEVFYFDKKIGTAYLNLNEVPERRNN
ncbi:M99 family carboxypeptidase catalytic domain-containing protein [candidate division KSB1 bacterium]